MKKIKQLLAITSILVICSSGKIDRGFDALNIYDFFKAKKLFTKTLKKDTVAASYGLSVIYGRKDNPFYNLDSAYKYIMLANTSYLNLDLKKINKLKKVSLDSSLISNWKDSIDVKVFQRAKRINSIQVYNNYLARHSNERINPIVTYKRDSIAFSEAKSINSSTSYAGFISTYSKSSFLNEAKNRYEERLFFQVVALNNPTEYQSFIKTYPKSPFNYQAQDSLFKMQTAVKNIAAYEKFIERYPRNRNVNKAWRMIYKLYTADFNPGKIVEFRLDYPEYPFLNELKTDFELATKKFYPNLKNGKWGFMDGNGNQMIDFVYEFVEPFSDGVALAIKNGSIGYINKSGNTVIPFQYSEGESFQSGLAVVAKNDKYGIISKTNTIILDFEYEEIGSLDAELILIANEVAYGYADKKGEIKVPLTYKTAYDFQNGLAVVKQGNQFGVINQLGVEVIKCQYEWLEPFDKYGRSKARLNGFYGIIDANGGVVVPFEYDAVGEYQCGLALLNKGKKYGYANLSGEISIPLTFDYLPGALIWGGFTHDKTKFHLKGKYGLLSKSGEKVFPAIFEDVGIFSDSNYVAVKKRSKWGFSNQNLRLMIPYQFQQAKTFKGTTGLIQQIDGWYLIDIEGKAINELPFIEVEEILDRFIKVKTLLGWGLIDYNNTIIIDSKYHSISLYNEEILTLKEQDKVLYYNMKTKSFLK